MKTTIIVLLAVMALFVGGCTTGQSYFRTGYDFGTVEKVAVVDVQGDVAGDAAKNQISDFVVMELLKKGYAPVERSQVQSVLKEQNFQASELTSADGAAQAGRILNVPAVIVVNIPNFGEEMSLTVKMIHVEDGSILWMGSGTGNTGRTLGTIIGAAGGAAAGAAAAGEGNEAVGGIAGGVLGGATGYALSPQKATTVQEIIKKICKTLPARIDQVFKK